MKDWSSSPGRGKKGCYYHHRVQTGIVGVPHSYAMGTGGAFPGDKAAGAWSWPLTI